MHKKSLHITEDLLKLALCTLSTFRSRLMR